MAENYFTGAADNLSPGIGPLPTSTVPVAVAPSGTQGLFPLGVPSQRVSYCGVGLCDPSMQNSVNAVKNFRYQRVLIVHTLAGGVAGGDILTAAQTIPAFTVGIGDSGAPVNIWWSLGTSDTDVFSTGYIPVRGMYFIIVGMAFQVTGNYQRGGTGSTSADARYNSAWLSVPEQGYLRQLNQIVIRDLAGFFTFGDSGCQYRAGKALHYPFWGGQVESLVSRNGNVQQPGTFLPFSTAFCAGPKDSDKQMTATLTTGQLSTVQNIAARPTEIPAGTNPNGNIYTEVEVVLPGFEVCLPDASQCARPLTALEARALMGG